MEYPIYGLTREGIARPDTSIYSRFQDTITTRVVGQKAYELTDQLGNVRATISDIKLPTGTPGSGPYKADFLSYMNPYPFGMPQPGRFWESKVYRYGYNGMERDDELKGAGESYATEYRMFDPRVGRWLSQDPVTQFAESPYVGLGNNPILFTDRHGRTIWDDIFGSDATPLEPAKKGLIGDVGDFFGGVFGGDATPPVAAGTVTIGQVQPSWEAALDQKFAEQLARSAAEAAKDLSEWAVSDAGDLVLGGASWGGRLLGGTAAGFITFLTPTPISDGNNLSQTERDRLSELLKRRRMGGVDPMASHEEIELQNLMNRASDYDLQSSLYGFYMVGPPPNVGGFEKLPDELRACALELLAIAYREGAYDAVVGVRGSAVTGHSFNDPDKKFGPESDIDFFIVSSVLGDGLKASKNQPGFIHADKVQTKYSISKDWANRWTKATDRAKKPVSVGIWIDGPPSGEYVLLTK